MLCKVVSFTVRPFCETEKRRWNPDVEAEQIGRGGGDAQPALQNHHWAGPKDSWASALSRRSISLPFLTLIKFEGSCERGIWMSRAHHPRQNLWVHRKCVIGTAGLWGVPTHEVRRPDSVSAWSLTSWATPGIEHFMTIGTASVQVVIQILGEYEGEQLFPF